MKQLFIKIKLIIQLKGRKNFITLISIYSKVLSKTKISYFYNNEE